MTKTGKTKVWKTASSEETIAVGRELAALLKPPQMILLRGGMGAGKTTLMKGMAEALGAAEAEEVTSPTFTLIHEYEGEQEGAKVRLFHLDVYRLEQERQLETLGWEELRAADSLVLVEWGDKFPVLAQQADGEIEIEPLEGDGRKVTLRMKPEAKSS
jgi:tRNA threonylcarbamoyladenosine biosynthesis protein TsaE